MLRVLFNFRTCRSLFHSSCSTVSSNSSNTRHSSPHDIKNTSSTNAGAFMWPSLDGVADCLYYSMLVVDYVMLAIDLVRLNFSSPKHRIDRF